MSQTIMVVDDDPDFQAVIRLGLEQFGYKVLSAETAAKAMEAMNTCRPDLAIVDLMLDELDSGFVLCYHIKKADATIPIILVSSVHSTMGLSFAAKTEEERSWIKAEVMLDKPIRFESLHSEILKLLPAEA